MNSCELVSFVTAISCTIAQCVPLENLPEVAAIFGQIGSTLATIAVNEAEKKPEEAVPELVPPNTPIVDTSPTQAAG